MDELKELLGRLREGTTGTDIAKTDPYLNALMRQAADALDAEKTRADALTESVKVWQGRTVTIKHRADAAEAERDAFKAALLEISDSLLIADIWEARAIADTVLAQTRDDPAPESAPHP